MRFICDATLQKTRCERATLHHDRSHTLGQSPNASKIGEEEASLESTTPGSRFV